jgi:riboflavin biosynthesis pyrimidine reductase
LKVTQHFPIQRELEILSLDQAQELYPKVTGFRFNYVIRVGNTESHSNLVSSDADRFFLKAIRSQSDLIVSTGATARAESLKASKYAPLLLLTKQKRLDCPATQVESVQPVYVSVPKQHFLNSNAIALGVTTTPLSSWLIALITSKAYNCIVFESGLTVTREIINMDLAAEFCLTVTGAADSVTAISSADRFVRDLGVNPELLQLLEADQTFLFRFDLRKRTQL